MKRTFLLSFILSIALFSSAMTKDSLALSHHEFRLGWGDFIVKGPDHENVLDWYPHLQAGDSIYVLAVGYEQGELTTQIFSKSFAIQ